MRFAKVDERRSAVNHELFACVHARGRILGSVSFSPDPVAGHKIDRMVDGLHDEFGGEFTRDQIAVLMGDD